MRSVNILYVNNGVGLTKDALILKSILEKEYDVFLVDKTKLLKASQADIAIHLEHVYFQYFRLGKKNIYFPNAEWYQGGWNRYLYNFNVVCAKTHDCERIFKQKHLNVVYTGFTSIDKFDPTIDKKKAYIHAAGKSSAKHTNEVYNAWLPEFGKIVMLSHYKNKSKENILCKDWIDGKLLNNVQNACLIHVCPSSYEGFGHYINEALSCGAVIVTTNGEPMREFVFNGNGFFCEPVSHTKKDLVLFSNLNSDSIRKTIFDVEGTSIRTLKEMGNASRELFLKNDKLFKERILTIISEL